MAKIPVHQAHRATAKIPVHRVSKFLRQPLVDQCICGERVRPWEPQQIVWDPAAGVFYRRCRKCLAADRQLEIERNLSLPR